jgi:ABC-2 type transport system ATP-binding protein
MNGVPEAIDSTPAVEIRDLRVDYGDNVAVDGISLEIPPGEIFGLVGPNGAGKTSTFKVLATLMEPTYGEVLLCGFDIAEKRGRVPRLLGYMPDLAPVPSDLKVWEFLDLFASSHGVKRKERREKIEEALVHVQLTDRREDQCKSLSRGMKQRLALAKTMLHEPRVMLLDEPASGMDPVSRAALRRTLQTVASRGTTVLISSHILTELSAMCTSVGIMSKGTVVASGKIEDVLSRFSEQKVLSVCLSGESARAREIFEAHPQISKVQMEGATLSGSFEGDENAQVALLAALVHASCPVQTFSEKSRDIESIILDLDKPTIETTLTEDV